MRLRYALFDATTPLVRVWWRFNRGVTLGARVAAVDADGRIALVRHSFQPGWYLPGGGVESGEHAEEAARRELEEEAHAAPDGSFELLGVYTNFASFRGDHVMLYRVQARSLGPRPPDREIAEVAWVDPAAPPADATPATLRRLGELFGGQPRHQHW